MNLADVAFLLAGIAIVAFALGSAIRTVVLPRAAPDPISRTIFRANYRVVAGIARRRRSFAARDRIMALLAPVDLLQLPMAWIAVVGTGYMAIFWALGVDRWRGAFTVSGSSLLTLGFAPVEGIPQTLAAFTEAVIGLGVVALLITYLPTMYAAFRKREAGVALLEVRAGAPPSGVELLERYQRISWTERVPDVFAEWEEWFIDIEESHTSLPSLVFFRSPQPDRSWVTAAGAVLDAASLAASSIDWPRNPQAEVLIRAGYVSLRRIADTFGIPYDPDPAPDDPISVARDEYDDAHQQFADAGLPLRPDREQARRDSAGWQVNYDRALVGLAGLVLAPPAQWSSDRSLTDWRRPPALRRWGRRLRKARS